MKKNILKRVEKRSIVFYSLLFMLCFTISSNAQEISREQLVGSWILNYDASFSKMESKSKTRYDSIPQERRLKIENSYRNRKMYLKNDGSYLLVLSDGREALGRWIYNSETKSIEVTDSNERTHIQKIKSIEAQNMVLKPKGVGKGTLMISELHFTKL